MELIQISKFQQKNKMFERLTGNPTLREVGEILLLHTGNIVEVVHSDGLCNNCIAFNSSENVKCIDLMPMCAEVKFKKIS